MVRWWWFGCALSKREIARQLAQMHRAGIGGVEIQPVYPLCVDDPRRGIVNVPYLSDAWLDYLKFAVAQAGRLGLVVDVTFGSGWPFGGPWIDKKHGAGCIRVRVKNLELSEPSQQTYHVRLSKDEDEELLAVHLYRKEQGKLIAASFQDLTERFDRDGRGRFDVPAGRWCVLAFVRTHTGMQVKRPAVGAEGPVLDHFCQQAFARHAEYLGARLDRAVASDYGKTIRAMFCDSYEVYRSNWTGKFLEAFRRRRGYDLRPYLAHLFYAIDDRTPAIRYDYAKTRSELCLAEFFEPFAAWCRSRGLQSRVQAHGCPAEILAAYASADIPEAESFGQADQLELDIQHRKLASSAAHGYGKRICSCESFTWLRRPRFRVTLEQMKVASDSIFLHGVNQIVAHGFPYSPPETGTPGWAFYASTFVNDKNTWWPYFRYLADYIARCSYVFQAGQYVADIAVYLPTHDVWSQAKADVFNLSRLLHERLDRQMLLELNRAGWNFDFVNDAILCNPSKMQRFAVLCLPAVRRMPVRSAEALVSFADRAGKVVAWQCWPDEAPGLVDRQERSQRVRELIGKLRKRTDASCQLAASKQRLLAILRSWLQPDCLIESDQKDLGFVHYKCGRRDVYFIANLSPTAARAKIRLRSGGPAATLWDPMTGRRFALPDFQSTNGHLSGRMDFEPFASKMIVLSPSRPEPVAADRKLGPIVHRQSIRGPWQLVEVPSGRILHRMDSLAFWTSFEELRGFSGTLAYKTSFRWPPGTHSANQAVFLTLEHVRQTVEVYLNGRHIRDLWIRPFRCEVSEALRPGRNELELRVSNLLINRVIAAGKPDHTALIAAYGRRFPEPKEQQAEIMDSGLAGEVTLTVCEIAR